MSFRGAHDKSGAFELFSFKAQFVVHRHERRVDNFALFMVLKSQRNRPKIDHGRFETKSRPDNFSLE